jgi:hypothetical protein
MVLDFVETDASRALATELRAALAALDAAQGLERIRLGARAAALAERLQRRKTLQPVRLQNGDRSTAASIAQVQSIAKKPDFDLLGFSKVATEGAPMAFADFDDVAIPAGLLGRKGTVTFTKDMTKVPIQYAVVPADAVMVSHDAFGAVVPGYELPEAPAGKLRAVAGNGRAAGIKQAYEIGTASGYKDALIEEAELLQLDAAAIERVDRLMLVRLMRHEDVTADIGDKTNSSGTAGLSALEQAKTDGARVDFGTLAFNDDGVPTHDAIVRFVRSMPLAEQATLAPDGAPTTQAVDRLVAATFARAYDSDALVKLYAQALDPDQERALGHGAGCRRHGGPGRARRLRHPPLRDGRGRVGQQRQAQRPAAGTHGRAARHGDAGRGQRHRGHVRPLRPRPAPDRRRLALAGAGGPGGGRRRRARHVRPEGQACAGPAGARRHGGRGEGDRVVAGQLGRTASGQPGAHRAVGRAATGGRPDRAGQAGV